ncbi:MAG: PRTRC system protein E [Azoarcus sp.]|jgi:PRTRC genetic system protein E|nr:PRTRC system protein E [Azoarcus sp.]
MTFFEELFALAAEATLALTISADPLAGRMTVNVVPKPKGDTANAALNKTLSLTATPAEFNEGFIAALKDYRAARHSLAEQLDATREVLAAAKDAAVKQAAEAAGKAVKAAANAPVPKLETTVATTEDSGFNLFG